MLDAKKAPAPRRGGKRSARKVSTRKSSPVMAPSAATATATDNTQSRVNLPTTTERPPEPRKARKTLQMSEEVRPERKLQAQAIAPMMDLLKKSSDLNLKPVPESPLESPSVQSSLRSQRILHYRAINNLVE